MKPCFAYIRVSTQKQGEGASLEAQTDAISDYAAKNSLRVAEWFEEKETAAKSGRPVFERMLKRLRKGEACGLIMHKIDRSARNLKDWAIVTELPDEGVDVFVATESLDFRSRGGRLTADIQAVIAADYIRNLREETTKGLNGRLKQGLYPFRAPLGYLDNGRGNPKTPCPVKAPLVQEAFRLYASGEYSLRALQAQLQSRGLKNHSGKPLSLHGVETLMQNPFYTGVIEIKRTGMIYEGVHEPIIAPRLFAQVQDLKAGRAGKKVTRHMHTYRGLFRCGLCDCAMNPERQKGHVYYRCQNPPCATKTVREERIDELVQERLGQLQLTDKQAQEMEQGWRRWLQGDERHAQIQSIELRINDAATKLERITDLMIEGTLDQSSYKDRKRAILLEVSKLREDLRLAQKDDVPEQRIRKFLELMKSLAELHRLAEPAEKRFLVENCFSNRRVIERNVEVEPSNLLTERDFAQLSPMVTRIATVLEPLQAERLKLLASEKS